MHSAKSITVFLAGTFLLSGIAFAAMLAIPAAQAPEGFPGLPIWLLAIWSPSAMAAYVAHKNQVLKPFLARVINFRGAAPALAIIMTPLMILIAIALLPGSAPNFEAVSLPFLGAILAFNLVLGPLGEELGWRGLLLPALEMRLGWLGAAIVVGVIWALWHAPLWLFASPQSLIPFAIFAGHAMCYSILMAAAHRLAPNSLVPAICLHTMFNSIVAVALLWELTDIPGFYAMSLPIYVLAAILVAGLLRGKAGCPAPKEPTRLA